MEMEHLPLPTELTPYGCYSNNIYCFCNINIEYHAYSAIGIKIQGTQSINKKLRNEEIKRHIYALIRMFKDTRHAEAILIL